MISTDQLIRAEFEAARSIVKTAWSEAEVLSALNRVEVLALLALGQVVCPPLPPDHIRVQPEEKWS